MKATNSLLKRIAEALELVVLYEYGVRIGHCAESLRDPKPHEKAAVEYETDESSVRSVLEQVARRGKVVDVIEDEEEFGV